MTSLSAAESKPRLLGRLLWVALALSLTLNICFVGGLIWSRVTTEPTLTPAQRFQQIAQELQLSPNERDGFDQFALEVRRHTRQLRESNMPLVQRVWEELGKAQPDQALISQLVDQATENRHTFQKEMTGALSRFLAGLTPEQRAQFVTLAKRQQDPNAAHIRRLVMP
jgi:uncharacterized membrane protein